MEANDVHHRLLTAPLAVYDEDDSESLIKIRKSFTGGRSSRSIENKKTRPYKYFSHHKNSPTLYLTEKHSHARVVRIRLVFVHIGKIDTLNERYQADIYFEARWTEKRLNLNALNLTAEQQTQLLNEDLPVKIDELRPIIHWAPQLFIENAIGQISEQNHWFTIQKIQSIPDESPSTFFIDLDICEHRRIKSVFWEKLELNHFPLDVQDLTVSITSHHHTGNCMLVRDEQFPSMINREAFFGQQEWFLYEHVATKIRGTEEEYFFDDEDSEFEQKKHPVLSFTCRAARRPGYYFWNGFCLIFLITISAFCIFSITPDQPQSRLQITCTLLLTSVAFRWMVNRSLPQISYLTTLDMYALISMILLVVLCIWHSIIAAIIFLNRIPTKTVGLKNSYFIIDLYVFISLLIIFTIMHMALVIWLIFVPYQRRREMDYLDREYATKKSDQLRELRIDHSTFS